MRSTDQVTPADLSEMPPGPVLAGFLSGVDVGRVSGYDQVVALRADQRMASHHATTSHE